MSETHTPRWTPEQFDTFKDMVLAGIGTADEVAEALVLFGANANTMRALAAAVRPYAAPLDR